MRSPETVDFSLPRPVGVRAWQVIATLAVVGLLAACVGLWIGSQRVARAKQARQAVLGVEASRAVPEEAGTAVASYRASADALLDQRGMDWPATLIELETVQVPGVRLVALEMDSQSKSTRIELRAPDQSKLGEFLNLLNAGVVRPPWRWVGVQLAIAQGGLSGEASYSATMEKVPAMPNAPSR